MANRRDVLVALCCAFAVTAQCAEESESLDEDFLSYLAEFEGEDDDWTIVEPAAKTTTSVKPAPGADGRAASKSSSQSTSPKPPPPKPATPVDGSKP